MSYLRYFFKVNLRVYLHLDTWKYWVLIYSLWEPFMNDVKWFFGFLTLSTPSFLLFLFTENAVQIFLPNLTFLLREYGCPLMTSQGERGGVAEKCDKTWLGRGGQEKTRAKRRFYLWQAVTWRRGLKTRKSTRHHLWTTPHLRTNP